MDDQATTDVLVRDGDRAWAVGRPSDLHGDGYVHTLRVVLSVGDLVARSWATFEGDSPETLRDFLGRLTSQWRGWEGVQHWRAMEGEMAVDATHDGVRRVRLVVTLWGGHDWEGEAWSVRVPFTSRPVSSSVSSPRRRTPC